MVDLAAEVSDVDPIASAVSAVPALSAALSVVGAITAAITIVSPLSANVTAVPALSHSVSAVAALQPALTVVPSITAEIEGVDLWSKSIEVGSRRPSDDVITLAAWATAIDIGGAAPNFVELPSALIPYPSFVDSGFLALTLSAAHVANGQTVSVRVIISQAGGGSVTIGPLTTTALTAGGVAVQFDFSMTLKNHGPTQAQYVARMVWTDAGGGLANTKAMDFTNRVVSLPFQNPSVDQGDVEIRMEMAVSSAATFTCRGGIIEQRGARAGSK